MGSSLEKAIKNIDSAVAEISNEESSAFNIKGVIRFVQLDEENCAIDGTVDGIKNFVSFAFNWKLFTVLFINFKA